jgi:hypothetical protein
MVQTIFVLLKCVPVPSGSPTAEISPLSAASTYPQHAILFRPGHFRPFVDSQNHAREDEIGDSMGAIVDISEKWTQYIRTRESQVRVVKSFLAGALVFLATSAAIVAYELMENPVPYFFLHREILEGVGVAAVVGLGCGVGLYVLFGRGKDPELEELRGLIANMKKASESERATENALSVTEKILTLLPKVVRRRTSDALLFGIAAFIIGSLFGTPAVGIIVGVLVWLYFRYESNQSYEKQMSRLEDQKRAFEKEKKSFIESL